jgi:mannose-1-phosphate guanylyltransferase
MATAMVLCAGFGSRLRPLTDELPKPLVPIGDRTILAHIAARLVRAGFGRTIINVHHHAHVFNNFINELETGLKVIQEPEIRGTAGGIAGARAEFEPGALLVWNGDIWIDPPVAELLAAAEFGGLCLGLAPRRCGEGTVGTDESGAVVRLRGERFGIEERGGDYVGVAALGERTLAELPERGCLIGDVALPELRRGGRVASVDVHSAWCDIGDPTGLLRANRTWLREQGRTSWLGPGATCASTVELRRSVVGKGARVSGRGLLEDCVICAGARVEAPLARAIVTPSGQVMRVGDGADRA